MPFWRKSKSAAAADTSVKVDWTDFYEAHSEHINLVDIREGRELSVFFKKASSALRPFVLFIHGSCARMGQFEGQLDHFSADAFDLNVVAFDRIGCGNSASPKEADAYSDANIFADLCAIVDHFVLSEDHPTDVHSADDTTAIAETEEKGDLPDDSAPDTGVSDELTQPPMAELQTEEIDCETAVKKSELPLATGSCKKRLFLVGHSYGTSQCVRLAAHLSQDTGICSRLSVECLVLCAAPDLSAESMLDTTASVLFSMPSTVLSWMSPTLASGFRGKALHKEGPHYEALVALESTKVNPVHMFKAFYTQSRIVNTEEMRTFAALGIRTVAIHGEDDAIVPLANGRKAFDCIRQLQHELATVGSDDSKQPDEEVKEVEAAADDCAEESRDFHVLPKCKHQVMQEYPDEVNALIQELFTLVGL